MDMKIIYLDYVERSEMKPPLSTVRKATERYA